VVAERPPLCLQRPAVRAATLLRGCTYFEVFAVAGGRIVARMAKYQGAVAISPVHLQGGRTVKKQENTPPRGKCAL